MSRAAATWGVSAIIALVLSASINLDLGPSDIATEAAVAADLAEAQTSAAKGLQTAQVQR